MISILKCPKIYFTLQTKQNTVLTSCVCQIKKFVNQINNDNHDMQNTYTKKEVLTTVLLCEKHSIWNKKIWNININKSGNKSKLTLNV